MVMAISDDDFMRQLLEVDKMPSPIAENRLREMHNDASQEGQAEHAIICLSHLAMLFSSENRETESVLIHIGIVRKKPCAWTLTELAYSLQRCRRHQLARHFFHRALEWPEEGVLGTRSHDHARRGLAGLRQLDQRKAESSTVLFKRCRRSS